MRLGRLIVMLPFMTWSCFAYRSPGAPSASTGARVRVLVSDVGTVRLAPLLGPGVQQVEGTVVGNSGDQLTLSLLELRRRGEQAVGWTGGEVTLERADVALVQEREFSRTKTAWAVAALAAAGAVVAIAVSGTLSDLFGGGGGGGDPTGH